MKRMKTFFRYAILIAAFWIVADLITYVCIHGTYKHKEVKINASVPQVIVTENKATYVNGYVKGSIKNNTVGILNNMYLKIDMYSSRDVNLGTKYVKINNLNSNGIQDFEMWYQYTDVDYLELTIVDEVPNVSEDAFLSQKVTFYIILGKLMFVYLML